MENTTQWDAFKDFLKSRKVKFKTFPVFYFYLLGVLILAGGFGIWTTLYFEFQNQVIIHKNICLALMGYAMPLSTSIAMDIFEIEAEKFIKRIFRILCFIVPIVLLILFMVLLNTLWAYLISGLTIIYALFCWWIANSKNSNLCDESYYTKNREKEQNLEQSMENL